MGFGLLNSVPPPVIDGDEPSNKRIEGELGIKPEIVMLGIIAGYVDAAKILESTYRHSASLRCALPLTYCPMKCSNAWTGRVSAYMQGDDVGKQGKYVSSCGEACEITCWCFALW